MTGYSEGNNPFGPKILDALRDLLAVSELPRRGNHFVLPDGTKHTVRTIGILAKYNCCRLRHDSRGRLVARINESIRSIVDAELGAAAAKRRELLAAEADELAKEEVA